MRDKSAGDDPIGVTAEPGRPRVAAALAEHLGEINRHWGGAAQLLAELALTPVTVTPAPETGGPERMWKAQQVADAWGVSIDTVRDWITAGELKTVRVGREYRVPDSECARFIRDHIRAAAALQHRAA